MNKKAPETLQEAFSKVRIKEEDIEKAITDYHRFSKADAKKFSVITSIDLTGFVDDPIKPTKISEGIIYNNYIRYLSSRNKIADIHDESQDWSKAFDIAVNIIEAQEAFLDHVEEVYQTKVKDAKHMQELTGLTADLITIDKVFTAARYTRYLRALEVAIDASAKFKDLLKIVPQDYGLEESETTQYRAILFALKSQFLLYERIGTERPPLRDVAREMNVSYSVIMDAYKIK